MKVRATQAIMECLLEQEVDTVFGYPGGTILNLYDELYHYQDRIHHVLTAHEQGAAHAADGYARSTGKAGVGGSLLVSRKHVADPVTVFIQGVVNIQHGAAGIPEHRIHPLFQQAFRYDLRSCQFHRLHCLSKISPWFSRNHPLIPAL